MAGICATISKGSKQLKELNTPIAEGGISELINALKEAKDTTNSFLTELVNEQKDIASNSTRKAEEIVSSDEDLEEAIKKQKR